MSGTDTISMGDPLPRLGTVSPHTGWAVAVTWCAGSREGRRETVDLAPMIFAFRHYRPLRDDPDLFKTVRLAADGTAIAWGEGAVDMAATTLERLAEETMTPADFSAFLSRHRLTFDAAAAQLGISRRLVAYYAKERAVPRYIALACAYLDERLAPQRPAIPASPEAAARTAV